MGRPVNPRHQFGDGLNIRQHRRDETQPRDRSLSLGGFVEIEFEVTTCRQPRFTHDFVSMPVEAVLAGAVADHYDIILLCCKAYDLDDAMAAIAPAVGPDSAILPGS